MKFTRRGRLAPFEVDRDRERTALSRRPRRTAWPSSSRPGPGRTRERKEIAVRRAFGRAPVLFFSLVALGFGPAARSAYAEAPARRAFEPAAPELPGATVAAL